VGAERLVEVWRGGLLESSHVGHAVVVDRERDVLACTGDPERRVFLRSSAKPFQSMAVVLSGAADRFGFEDRDLAVATASHTGEDVHLQQVRHLLQLVGMHERDLGCGVHPPTDRAAQEELARRGEQPSVLHNNCSGKHAAMLGVARALGADPGHYLDAGEPGQRLVRSVVSAMCSVPEDEIDVGIDGCSAPVFAVPLRAMALGYARLADPSGLPADLRSAALRVRGAMLAHPYLVAGRGQVGVDIMRVGAGRLVAKTGAEAVFGVADLVRGQGFALKIEDGLERGVAPALIEGLRQAGFLDEDQVRELEPWRAHDLVNFRGLTVGRVVPNLNLRPLVRR